MLVGPPRGRVAWGVLGLVLGVLSWRPRLVLLATIGEGDDAATKLLLCPTRKIARRLVGADRGLTSPTADGPAQIRADQTERLATRVVNIRVTLLGPALAVDGIHRLETSLAGTLAIPTPTALRGVDTRHRPSKAAAGGSSVIKGRATPPITAFITRQIMGTPRVLSCDGRTPSPPRSPTSRAPERRRATDQDKGERANRTTPITAMA